MYLANIYISYGAHEKAIKLLKKVLETDQKNSILYFNLGSIHFMKKEYSKSIPYFLKGIKFDPDNSFAYKNLATCYEQILDYKNAVENYKKSYYLNNKLPQVREKLIELQPEICDWSLNGFYENWRKEFINDKKFKGAPLSFLWMEGDPEKEFLMAKHFYNLYCRSSIINNFKKEHNSNNRIKVGYISADFRIHPVSILLSRIIELHDKTKFEIYGYSLSKYEDEMTLRLKKSFDKFVNLGELKINERISLIRKDNIDIAIDLMGYTRNARADLFANRIAPKQVGFLGYPGTSGGDSIDYLIADKHTIPVEYSKFYSEKILYMPKTFMPFDNTIEIADQKISRKTYGLPVDKFILAGFHRIEKINPKVLDLWSKVLKILDSAVLWLREPPPYAVENLFLEFNKRGISKDRIYFAKKTKHLSEHLLRHKLADVFIDTFFYSSHSTGLLALWTGLPVVTMRGLNFASRVVPSFLENLSMNDLIANDEEEYIKIISDLYEKRDVLKKLKNRLLKDKEENKIFNSEFFVRELEKLYISIKD